MAVREYQKMVSALPPSRWLEAIHDDRKSEDYASDPDAIN